MTKKKEFDTRAKIATEVTLLFVVLTLITATSGPFRVGQVVGLGAEAHDLLHHDALVIAYFVLRNSIEDEERRATYAACSHHRLHRCADLVRDHASRALVGAPGRAGSGGGLEGWQLWPSFRAFGMLMLAWSSIRSDCARSSSRTGSTHQSALEG